MYVVLAEGQELVTRQPTSNAVALPTAGTPIRLVLSPADTVVVPRTDAS